MAYKAYLIRQYEHTHENSFFRKFSTQLRKIYKDVDGINVLIGNISCNGHQIDALFIANGKIIVIDFKNYGGKLTFSENNPWSIVSENELVFVQGGGGIRNPYQQVNAYRRSLIQFLSNKKNDFLEPNHENFNLGHINGLVLFHQPITIDQKEIPEKILKYFKVVDINNCFSTIADCTSINLTLRDNEIEKILIALDIREENLYDETQELANPTMSESNPNEVDRLELVRKILANEQANSELEKLLLYYQTLINLERAKEPTITDEHSFHLDWKTITDIVRINIEDSPDFHQKFQQNEQHQFPKNLFVGINILFNSQTLPLLYSVIPNRDILSHTNIEIPIKDFGLYPKPLEERNYPDELIEELTSALNQQTTLSAKFKILEKYLSDTVQLVENLTLAFSEENPYTSQLLSEFKHISKEGLIKQDSFLYRFLTKKPIDNQIETIDESKFIQITPLNSSQKEAVKCSFNQPLTVITGPPGTGKTQVVLNILANAILHNKKVLVASKNNRAVDNVKERLSEKLNDPNFCLRFGSRNEVRDKTKPIIQSYINQIHNKTLEDNTEKLSKTQNSIEKAELNISNTLSKLEKTKILTNDICKIQNELNEKQTEYTAWDKVEHEAIFVFNKHSVESLDKQRTEIINSKNYIRNKYSGLRKIFFNLFSKKKYAFALVNLFELFPLDLKDLAKSKGIYPEMYQLKNGAIIINEYDKIANFIESGIRLKEQLSKFKQEINALNNHLKNSQNELQEIQSIETELRNSIKQSQEIIEKSGVPLVNELIHKKLRESKAADLNKYKEYIPENIPWKKEEIPEFIEATKKFLEVFNIASITSLSIKSAFPLAEDLFDMVVIDEASQCDIASAIPLILRSKQLVVIGDPMQLKHISKVQPYEEKYIIKTLKLNKNLRLDYINKSLYDYCFNLSILSRSDSIFLKEHFRCHPQIIGYSNYAFYGPKMGQELDIKTDPHNYMLEPKGIFWINCEGMHDKQKNINQLEKEKAIDLSLKLAAKHPNITIGITTPFKDQAKEFNEAIPLAHKERIKADTVHSFQGDEKDIMIISLVISHNSPKYKSEWINKKVPYLLNVAVSRAKNTLYIIGNANYCRTLPKDSPLGLLVKYVDEINPIIEKK